MRILADENVPRMAVEALRSAGHQVAWVRTEMPGADDRDVLARAEGDAFLLLTLDKGFGELALRRALAPSCGIVLLRMALPSPENAAELILNALQSRSDWAGHFSVIDDRGIRMRPLRPTGFVDT